jgi:hypothetical protein
MLFDTDNYTTETGKETLKKSKKIWKSAGDKYTIISSHLIRKKHQLGLTDAEFHVVQILVAHKHTDENPWPSIRTLCEWRWGEYNASKRRAMNLLLESLEKKSLIYKVVRKTDRGQQSNGYDISPLVERLERIIGDEAELHGGDEEILHGGDEEKLQGPHEAELHPKKNLEKEKEKRKGEKENHHQLLSGLNMFNSEGEENMNKQSKADHNRKREIFIKVNQSDLPDARKLELINQANKKNFSVKQIEAIIFSEVRGAAHGIH